MKFEVLQAFFKKQNVPLCPYQRKEGEEVDLADLSCTLPDLSDPVQGY